MTLKRRYKAEAEEAERLIEALTRRQAAEAAHTPENPFLAAFGSFRGADVLTKEMAQALIERVYVDGDSNIEIVFRYRDEYKELCTYLEGRKTDAYEAASGSGNPLKRKVICGVCGHAMQRDNKKNGSYRCVTKRLNTGFDCSEDGILEADILEAVVDTIQGYAQYAVSIDRLLQTRQEQRQLERKQEQHRLQMLQSRKAQFDERLQDLYERLVEGEISRESYAAQKKALTAQTEEITRTVSELERKISGSDDKGNAVIEHFKSYAGITALTREISIDLLHSVTIYPDGRMDIRLNLVDEIKALMETLRRESCTA